MPITRRSGRSSRREAGDHAGVRRAGHGAHDDGVEEDAQLRLLRRHLAGPVGEAHAAERVVARRRPGWRRASRRRPRPSRRARPSTSRGCRCRSRASSSRMSPPMIRRQLDVADRCRRPGRRQSTQCSCTVTALSPRWSATPVTWRVWFDWTPPMDTSVSQPWASASAARYSSLRTLLPPKAMPAVAVLALGPDLDVAPERRRESLERVDRGWPEEQGYARVVVESHGCPLGDGRACGQC